MSQSSAFFSLGGMSERLDFAPDLGLNIWTGELRPCFTLTWRLIQQMNSSRITKDLHVHKPITRMVMTYTDPQGKRVAELCDMRHKSTGDFIFRTLRWASNNGIEVIFRPA